MGARAPGPSRDAIADRQASIASTRGEPWYVESADLTDSLVAFLDLLTDVPGTAPDLPLMHARIAAECAARRLDQAVTPAADRFTGGVAFGLAPLLGGHHARATSAHAMGYRRMSAWALDLVQNRSRTEKLQVYK